MKAPLFTFPIFLTFLESLKLSEGIRGKPTCIETELTGGCGVQRCIFQRGDAWANWEETEDGYSLCRQNGELYFALGPSETNGYGFECSDVRFDCENEVPPAALSLQQHIRPMPIQQDFNADLMPPTIVQQAAMNRLNGTFNRETKRLRNLVLLLQFADHTMKYSVDDYTTLMNKPGGDPANNIGPTGSVKDFFDYNLNGYYDIEATVIHPGVSAYTEAEAAGMGECHGTCQLAKLRDAIQEALQAASELVDFRDFDLDNDGWVDMFTIIHSGHGREQGSGTGDGRNIWSHKWVLKGLGFESKGIKVYNYNINPGLWGPTGTPNPEITRIGVIAHESMHYLGLPDLYDRDRGGHGIGDYGLMSGGTWNGDQLEPASLCAWSKEQLGVADIIHAAGVAGTYELRSQMSPDGSSIVRIDMANPGFLGTDDDEYILIENRARDGYDLLEGSGGILIWHIDPKVRTQNDVETYPGSSGWPQNHYMVRLIQGSGTYGLEKGIYPGRDQYNVSDYFHSKGRMKTLSDNTEPSINGYQHIESGTCSGIHLGNFSSKRNVMTFSYIQCTQDCSLQDPVECSKTWTAYPTPQPIPRSFPVPTTETERDDDSNRQYSSADDNILTYVITGGAVLGLILLLAVPLAVNRVTRGLNPTTEAIDAKVTFDQRPPHFITPNSNKQSAPNQELGTSNPMFSNSSANNV